MTAPDGPDPAVSKLLRWYPRAWRERYGAEFLAMVEDDLDGEAPTRRLRLSVAWAGLRERAHQVRRAGGAAARRPNAGNVVTWGLIGPVAGFLFALLPLELRTAPPPTRGWQATGALNTELVFVAFGGLAIVASALLAVPAFGRFLRAGGWPRIRRRVGWATAATVAAGGGLAGVVLTSAAKTFDSVNLSWGYFLSVAGTGLLIAVALGLWTYAAHGTARRLNLSRRIRAAEKVLVAVGAAAVTVMASASAFYAAATQASVPMLLVGIVTTASWIFNATLNLRRAVRQSKRLWSAPSRG